MSMTPEAKLLAMLVPKPETDLPETLRPDNAADAEADHAQLMAEYHEAVAAAETVKAVTETELHSQGTDKLTEEGRVKVLLWCKQQTQAIQKAEKRNKP